MYTEFNIKDGKIYTKSDLCERIDVFEIVEKIPAGFFVWNIGENMGSNEYIPLAQDLHPEDKENFEINTSTLKAIKLSLEEVNALRQAASWGVNNKDTAEKALKSKRTSYNAERKRKAATATLEIFKRITA